MNTFYEIDHHKQKIVFLISSLRNIIKNNTHKNIIHRKISKKNTLNLIKYLKELISTERFTKIIVSKPSDFQTKKDLMFFSQSNNIELEMLEDKKFISTDIRFYRLVI